MKSKILILSIFLLVFVFGMQAQQNNEFSNTDTTEVIDTNNIQNDTINDEFSDDEFSDDYIQYLLVF